MAKTTLSKDINSITIETGYSYIGTIATIIGAPYLLILYLGATSTYSTDMSGLVTLMLFIAALIGIVLFGGGVMALGTLQRLTYNIALKRISYRSSVAFLEGHSVSHSIDNLDTIHYELRMIHYPGIKSGQNALGVNEVKYSRDQIEAFKKWENTITLWYEDGFNTELPLIPHSDELEEGLKAIAEETQTEFKKVFISDRDDDKALRDIQKEYHGDRNMPFMKKAINND